MRRVVRPVFLAVFALVAAVAAAGEPAPSTGTVTGEVSAKPAKGRAGVVVALDKVPGTFRPPARPIDMDQKSMLFLPRVMAVLRGTTVRFLNSDSVRHNVFSPDGEKFDLGTWPQGESRTYTFKKTGVYRLLCNVHPEMAAFVVVLDNPFFAVTGDDGRFQIAGVPPGTYTVRAWSEKLPAATAKVTVVGGAAAKVTLELKKK